MGKVKIKMNIAGITEIRNSKEVQDDLLERAERIKEKAETFGSGKYIADVQPGKKRAHAMVKTTDYRSMASNAKHNSLLKSLDAGKG